MTNPVTREPMAHKLARDRSLGWTSGNGELLLLRARGEGVLVDVALHVGEVALHQLLRLLALARGDRRGNVVVEVGIDRLALEAMCVLAEPPPGRIALARMERI